MTNYEQELNSIVGDNSSSDTNISTNEISNIDNFVVNNRTITIPPTVTDIVVKGDTNSRTITFELNRYFDGVDLSTKTIRINYENSEGLTGNNEVANIVATESSLTFDWTIESGLTTSSGNVKIAIDCYEVNSNDNVIYRWQTIPLSFDVLDTIEVVNNAIALSYEKEKNFVTNNNNLTILTDIHDTDTPIEVVNRTINTPLYEDIVVSMDNNSQIISFTIDRYFDGVDLLNKVIAIKYINALNESDRTFAVNVSNTDNKITFGWLIDNKVTKKNGYVRFAIEFLGYLDNGEFYCWSTKPSQIEVSEGLYVDDSIEQPTPSWLQSWQIQADNNLKSMELQLRVNGNYVQWKHYNDSQWVNLFNIGDISGTTTKDNLTNIEAQTVVDTSSNSEYLRLIITDKDGNITTHDIKPVDGINGLTGIVYDIVDIDSTKSSLQTQIDKYMADTTFAKTTKSGQLWLLTQQSGNYTYELQGDIPLGEEPTKTLSLNKNTFIPIAFTFQTVPTIGTSTYTVGEPIELGGNEIKDIKVNGVSVINEKKEVDITIPTKTSQLTNDSDFIDNSVNNLVNYYLKTENYSKEESYSKDEINSLISTIKQFNIEVVESLPIVMKERTIYLVPNKSDEEDNYYNEYIYVNNKVELIGNTKVDISGKQDKLTAGANITITSDNVISATGGGLKEIQIGGSEPTDENVVLWFDESDSGYTIQYADGDTATYGGVTTNE